MSSKAGKAGKTWGSRGMDLLSWGPLISQAGVAIGIASVIASKFPAFGAGFRDVAIACVALNEMIGPILFKIAIDRTGESKAPTPTLAEAPAEEIL